MYVYRYSQLENLDQHRGQSLRLAPDTRVVSSLTECKDARKSRFGVPLNDPRRDKVHG